MLAATPPPLRPDNRPSEGVPVQQKLDHATVRAALKRTRMAYIPRTSALFSKVEEAAQESPRVNGAARPKDPEGV